MVRLTDRPNMTLDIYRGCKTKQQQQQSYQTPLISEAFLSLHNKVVLENKDESFSNYWCGKYQIAISIMFGVLFACDVQYM